MKKTKKHKAKPAKEKKHKKIKFVKKPQKKSSFRSLPPFEYKSETGISTKPAGAKTSKTAQFTARELKDFKTSLEKTKAEIIKRIQEKKNLDMPEAEVGDSIDQALQSLDKELLFEVTDSELVMIDQIEASIRRIEKGVFGICQSCGHKISRKRLKAIAFARYCVNCQSSNELSGGSRTETTI